MTKDEAVQKGHKLNRRTLPSFNKFLEQFPDEETCRQHFFNIRWPNGAVKCPRCASEKIAKINQPWRWQCRQCSKNGYRFSLTTATVFENTKYPLRLWFQVMYMMLNSKKGVSALQIHRQLDTGDYRTAWYLCHRIRAAMQSDELMQLSGEVEVDETYVGGKAKNKHKHQRGARGAKGKIAVIGAISRKGNVIAKVTESLDANTMTAFVKKSVSGDVSLVATDEHPSYVDLQRHFPHEFVTHAENEYVRGAVHTQSIDSFWSLLKRGIVGTYHKMGKEYLPLYINEFAFRHNNRDNRNVFDDVLRFA